MKGIRLVVAGAFFVAGVAGGFSLGIFERPVKLAGTVIPRPSAAPDFTLTDQNGQVFRMSDTRGKVVVMTFIYTHCTDLCPFVTMKVKSARDQLGKDADKAVFVAVTTDPERDTLKVINAYSRAAGLSDSWHFLTGSLASVKDVWFNYGVGVDIRKEPADDPAANKEAMSDMPEPTQGLSEDQLGKARTISDQFGGGYNVSHSTPYWIIDKSGRIRASMDADALPSEIAGNVRALMDR
jgi:cytochrome oxidase Cu insertion factor (SCO1/SenC/PrrC family)